MFGHEYPCIVLDLTMKYLTNGEAPRLFCDFHSPHEEEQEAFKSLNRVPPRNFANIGALQRLRGDSENEILKHVIPPIDNKCFPYCDACFTGICKDCEKCVGK